MSDRAKELERAIFNWYLEGDNAAPEPIFNVIADGYEYDLQMIVPIETSDEMIKMMGDDGKYFIPLFTSKDEVDKGEPTSTINQPIKVLFDALENWIDCLGFMINPWGQKLVLEKSTVQMLKSYERRAHISIIRGSVLEPHVSAIVNAANNSLLGGGGVDGAIHRAAGPELLAECRTLNGCETGAAKSTKAYNITTADDIIHTVGPVYSGKPTDRVQLSSCYTSSLDESFENGNDSVAFPCISTGVYGYPLDEAAHVALTSIANWLDDHYGILKNVYICCFRDEEYEAYMRLIKG
ncbi:macro domain-containing protein [Butyrivibrio hungatei]|uniref:Macro domain-containing protein n=1 Tax=Butyrivibrio hungatei TaxID=185008 RepID=A0A1D9P0T1_9FIRM|nr:macro domain-containing protein [Butyrivibrio hungatei]AOZ96236.1 macro domain-containing protein [Butyrivibrio hungatei]